MEWRRTQGGDGLYERLLQRLSVALVEAENMERVSANPAQELELRDLTSAELELIRAYLDRDLDWLRGWHAAAEELALIEHWPPRTLKPRRPAGRPVTKPQTKAKPFAKRHVQLCCALCGVAADRQLRQGVQACRVCGSQLFRAHDPR